MLQLRWLLLLRLRRWPTELTLPPPTPCESSLIRELALALALSVLLLRPPLLFVRMLLADLGLMLLLEDAVRVVRVASAD